MRVWSHGKVGQVTVERQKTEIFTYKKVANWVKPMVTTLPEGFQIVRRKLLNPLEGLPTLLVQLPEFEPQGRYTRERHDTLNVTGDGFLWPEEVKLTDFLMCAHDMAFAWDETEKGQFQNEYFDLVVILTVEHIP
ncbi:uncharacterized protein LAESUDRAFT_658461 [Laetiporus sulphureus 93-53]|uniref:Uncharacterized protein n=1 Tax=Laetiporus sulphureus 93-53 TaxID=1314785 RepID=A0A165D335_9APHY|nr:uncharacterized protein LAESUDRAFT_658461 [Laetiporus sulphureus 93-53]KZT04061.1 hypothetical protein LAESUDRAFT_658461 [Laetiporus sulphureus 93-53]